MSNAEIQNLKIIVNTQSSIINDWMVCFKMDAPIPIAMGETVLLTLDTRLPVPTKWANPLDLTKIVGMPKGVYFVTIDLLCEMAKAEIFKVKVMMQDASVPAQDIVNARWNLDAGSPEGERGFCFIRPLGPNTAPLGGEIDHVVVRNDGDEDIILDGIVVSFQKIFGGMSID